jgi:N-acetyl-gamma-glutamyl-phosphate/LysW-gamma-L-alpha-aminoadipyl-6-phosphate reductase
MSVRISIVGGSGYTAGEMLRLIINHPELKIGQVVSRSNAGQPLWRLHPHLRGHDLPSFVDTDSLTETDILILAQPHGIAQQNITYYSEISPKIIDLSSDFRLNTPTNYEKWYGDAHLAPDWLPRFVYGLPETYRKEIGNSQHVSGVGCNATATILALLPLIKHDLLITDRPIIAEIKTGSSEGGSKVNPGSHHPVRSGSVRSYASVGHRHTAEIQQVLGVEDLHISLTAIEMVRGALATVHGFVNPSTNLKDLWKAYRSTYKHEPFVRIVRDNHGNYRRPEPKIISGSNFADVGFDLDPQTGRVVSICAIDNLMKGSVGTAMQCVNLMCGFEETTGLEFTGLHPI